MQYHAFLIKYAEIGTKGKNRYMFEDALMKQIRYALKEVEGQFEVTKEAGRIYVNAEGYYEYEDVVEALKRVFGIADICPMVQVEDRDFENIKKQVIAYMDQVYPDKSLTFKVDARRVDKNYPVGSEQMNRDLGEAILEAFPQMKVDVHTPQVRLRVEVRQKVNLFSVVIPGPGGMPVGTNGKATLLLSGGIDSPVAGYMIAKRGVEVECVHFFSYPYTSQLAKDKVLELARLVTVHDGDCPADCQAGRLRRPHYRRESGPGGQPDHAGHGSHGSRGGHSHFHAPDWHGQGGDCHHRPENRHPGNLYSAL